MTKSESLIRLQEMKDAHDVQREGTPIWTNYATQAEARRKTEALREERELAKLDEDPYS